MSSGRNIGRRITSATPAAIAAAVLMLSLAAAPIASAQADQSTITVVVTEYHFTPDTVTLTVGKPVQLNIENRGGQDHSLLSDIPVSAVHYVKADNTRGELQAYEANNVINADVGSGHTSVVMFTPTRAGSFEFFSEDEEDLGLTAHFVVATPGGQAAAPAAPAPVTASSATIARDGQSLASQPAATQNAFKAVWGDRAAQEWVQEHNAALPR